MHKITYGLGEPRAKCGDTVLALPLVELAAERAGSMRYVAGLHEALRALGQGYLLAGRPAEARETAERMLKVTRAIGHRYGEGKALQIIGEVHARANPVEA